MNATKDGFIDGLLGRSSANPYGHDQYKRFEAYTVAFLEGMTQRQQYGITIRVERQTNDE